MDTHDSRGPRDKSMALAWRRLTIGRQLLIAVNSALFIVAGVFLFLDYQIRFGRQMEEKRIALSEEAKTMYESLLAVETRGQDAMQDLIDNVCARMNSSESPGHHIAVQWGGLELQAKSHGHASPDMFAAMRAATGMNSGPNKLATSMVVGAFPGNAGTVYVSEKRSMVVAEANRSLLAHALAVIALAAIAAFIVNVVLRRVISSPMKGITKALHRVATGDLTVIVDGGSCQELSYLTDQVNAMTRSLEESERDRRFHMEKARQIQQHLLPRDREIPGLSVAKLFEPAEDVGGDFFDVVSLSEHQQLVCVADVTGHGVPAAMAAAVIKTLVQNAAENTDSPAEILRRVNRRYSEIILPGHLATMVAIVIDTRCSTVTYANAGHEPPFLQLPGGEIRRLMTGDLLLGVDDDATYEEDTVSLTGGTKIVVVSDGVTEAFDPDENQFGEERILNAINQSSSMSPVEVVGRFVHDLESFRRSRPAFDDTTLVVVEVLSEHKELEVPASLSIA